MFHGLKVFVLLTAMLPAATLDKKTADTVVRCVYEVVLPKPVDDPLRYERPLPFELLPYRERTDKYQSIGTAFAVGSNTFITAAHVFEAGMEGNTVLLLRDSSGTVVPFGEILRYSKQRDFIQFTAAVGNRSWLGTNGTADMNMDVFTVGNALGEGVVIRDGTLTSVTPEDERGEWKWLRYSAPASPGNSGGPLVDASGNVIGIVVMKSRNENLNFALPITEVESVKLSVAEYRRRFDYVMPDTERKQIGYCDYSAALPIDSISLYRLIVSNVHDYCVRSLQAIKVKSPGTLFPDGDGAGKIRYDRVSLFNPSLVREDAAGKWHTNAAVYSKNIDVGSNAYIRFGIQMPYIVSRIRRSSNSSFADFITNGQLQMDYILKAVPFTRSVGGDKVRILSYGQPEREKTITDSYGRVWIFRAWWLPYARNYMATLTLPLPDGCASLMKDTGMAALDMYTELDMRESADHIRMNYGGTLNDWNEFLANEKFRPQHFQGASIQTEGESLSFTTSAFSLNCPGTLFPTAPATMLEVRLGYVKEHDAWKLNVASCMFMDRLRMLGLSRYQVPDDTAPAEYVTYYTKLSNRIAPYDKPRMMTGRTNRIDAQLEYLNESAVSANGTKYQLFYENHDTNEAFAAAQIIARGKQIAAGVRVTE
ncbi:MAG: trypsin-like peptidase domain-containing protein [Spirochaetes bacterium]|nr:trypsin-like peptidase domain-containing protein [Spirochaetota bacterium]